MILYINIIRIYIKNKSRSRSFNQNKCVIRMNNISLCVRKEVYLASIKEDER